MNAEHRRSPKDVLDQATEAMKEEQIVAGPKPELVAATLAALESETEFFAVTPAVVAARDGAARNEASTERNTQMFRIIRWGLLAAAVLLLIGGIGLRGVWERGGSVAFGQVVENMKRATSVSLVVHYQRNEGGARHNELVKAYTQGELLRLEISRSSGADQEVQPDQVLGADTSNGECWELDLRPKTYKTFTLDEAGREQFAKPIEVLTEVTDKDAELVGDETLDGTKVRVYRLLPGEFRLQGWKIEKGATAKVWVDAESGLPVRIEGDFVDPSNQANIHARYDQFQWNKPIDPKLFVLEVPEGFTKEKAE